MTQWNHQIGRQITNVLPAWRGAMSTINTLYPVAPPGNLAAGRNSTLESQISWPPANTFAPAPFQLWGENEVDTVDQPGWTGVVYAQDASTYGKLINQSAGEYSLPNNAQALDLTTGLFEMWQQPVGVASQSAALAIDADCYFNWAEYLAMPAGQRSDGGSVLWNPITYPLGPGKIAVGGWVYYRKATTLSQGSGVTYHNRYNTSCWIPATMTGFGAGARVVQEDSHTGPGGGGGGPSGMTTDAQFFDATRIRGDGTVIMRPRWQNTVTKARGSFPVSNPKKFTDIMRNWAVVDESTKRLYYYNSNDSLYYFDLTNGIAGAAVSSVIPLTIIGGNVTIGFARSSVEFTANHPTGRRLFYFMDESALNTLGMVDIATARQYRLTIPGLTLHSATISECEVAIGYHASTNKLLLTSRSIDGLTIKSHIIQIPSDPTVAASYTATNTTLGVGGGATLENAHVYMYGQGKYIASLGVCIIKQYRSYHLAYIPNV